MSETDESLPSFFWNQLSQDDKSEFIRIRSSFHESQKTVSRDRRSITFHRELNTAFQFIERRPDHIDVRAILTGVCFAGPIVCVNNRQLKSFLSRCKSSINGSFQQLGFVALRSKAKARDCVAAVLPALQNMPISRQWTARYVSEDAPLCFLSSIPRDNLPPILPEDLYDERRTVPIARPPPLPVYPAGAPLKPKILEADPLALDDFWEREGPDDRDIAMRFSVSMHAVDLDLFSPRIAPPTPLKKSGSVQVQSFGRTWNLFDDDDDDRIF
jgi:hypothetical protein